MFLLNLCCFVCRRLLDILRPEELERLESALCSSEGLCTSSRNNTGQLKAVTVVVKRRPRTHRLHAVSQEDDSEEDGKRSLTESKSCPDAPSMYTKAGRRLEKWEEPSAQELRAAFPNTDDLLQRLFVAISGIADQMHQNFAGQLRTMLQRVFQVCTPDEDTEAEMPAEQQEEKVNAEAEQEACVAPQADPVQSPRHMEAHSPLHSRPESPHERADSPNSDRSPDHSPQHAYDASNSRPVWVPDSNTTACQLCEQPFTVVRRKHHCRSCGQVFCARCSSNAVPLPHLSYNRPVRVCNNCHAGQAAASLEQAQ